MRLSYHTIFNLLALTAASAIRLHQAGAARDATPQAITINRRSNSRRQAGNNVAVTFNQVVETAWGEAVQVIGSIPQLGTWDTSQAVSLDAAQYTDENPLWSGTVGIPAGTAFTYKYIRIGADGTVTWEADPDRSFVVPGSGNSATRSDTWQSAGAQGSHFRQRR